MTFMATATNTATCSHQPTSQHRQSHLRGKYWQLMAIGETKLWSSISFVSKSVFQLCVLYFQFSFSTQISDSLFPSLSFRLSFTNLNESKQQHNNAPSCQMDPVLSDKIHFLLQSCCCNVNHALDLKGCVSFLKMWRFTACASSVAAKSPFQSVVCLFSLVVSAA